MKFTLPLLLSLSTLVLTHPLAERAADTVDETQVTTTLHLATTSHFFNEEAVAVAAADTDTVVSTENGLSTDACKPVIVIFARGTTEEGNIGLRVGPPLIASLRSALTTAKVTMQGVDYSANVLGYLAGGDNAGSETLANLTTYASNKCPKAKLVIGGYSQGAQLVHKGVKLLSAAVTAKIAAVVVFGDPDNGQAVGNVASSKVWSICHEYDIVCSGFGAFVTHLTYVNDVPTASAFIVKAVGAV
ncbi:hypothetical protein DSL72_008216 [Monilinia vaccinii-corymbosi]|uniref:Cutinase n=1 Tax=Monilinia vaccinii-corymbosi TaxID=61207 RepID=A0A8A3PKC3_9HELO|nr:hypothetical protein DSL72_008216 [Monilinia vaccinii-corymbosi]